MSPGRLLNFLGLCNLVAGALFVLAPDRLLPIDGIDTPAGRLLGRALALFLVGSAAGGWLMPDAARVRYLWLFGVGVKVAAGALWLIVAGRTGQSVLWAGAAADLLVAVVVAIGLTRRSGRRRAATLQQEVHRDAGAEDRQARQ